MAFSPVPTAWIPSYTASGAVITGMAPTELTSAEANATTGDVRQIYYALAAMMYDTYNAKASIDRPAKMVLTKFINTDTVTGKSTVTFSFAFTCDSGSMNVTSE